MITLDPVCGMTVSPDTPYRYTWEGEEYGFCCAGCMRKFEAEPGRWTKKAEAAPKLVTIGLKKKPAPAPVSASEPVPAPAPVH